MLNKPSEAEVRLALKCILSSATFARSERLRAFLSYVVTKDLEGLAGQLKGYTIAVDVFRRPDAFNADSDPLVRVHAGKLRKSLATYYENEGAGSAWQIEIPRGGYAPIYVSRAVSQAQASLPEQRVVDNRPVQTEREDARAPAVPDRASPLIPSTDIRTQPSARRARPGWLPAPLTSPVAMISILPLLLFAPLSSTALGISPQVQARLAVATRMSSAEVPRVTVRLEGGETSPAADLAGQIRVAMDYYTVIIVAAPQAVSSLQGQQVNPLAFTIAVAPSEGKDETRVTVSSEVTGDVVSEMLIENEQLSNDFDVLFESLGIAAKTLATNGDLFHYAVDKGIASPLMQCMLVTDTYRREKSRDTFKAARLCQEKLLGRGKDQDFIISAAELRKNVRP